MFSTLSILPGQLVVFCIQTTRLTFLYVILLIGNELLYLKRYFKAFNATLLLMKRMIVLINKCKFCAKRWNSNINYTISMVRNLSSNIFNIYVIATIVEKVGNYEILDLWIPKPLSLLQPELFVKIV